MICTAGCAFAQDAIYRCGNVYTNNKAQAQAKGCKLMDGGNVTVIQGGPRSQASAAAPRTAAVTPSPSGSRVDASQQRARDADARLILQDELKKALARRDELNQVYNNGEPEKLAPETRNHQKYLDRVAELKASLARANADVAGIQRELERLPAAPAGASSP